MGAMLLVGVIGAVLLGQRAGARLAELEEWARANGWTVVRRPAVDWIRRLDENSTDRVTFAVQGLVDGRPVAIGEFDLSTWSHVSGPKHRRFVVLMAQLREPARTVAVHRRTAWERSDRQLARDRPTRTGFDAFDQAYRVVAPDPRAVQVVIGPGLIGAHVAGDLPDWSVTGTDVLTFRSGEIGPPAGIPGLLRPILRVADLIEADAAAEPDRDPQVPV